MFNWQYFFTLQLDCISRSLTCSWSRSHFAVNTNVSTCVIKCRCNTVIVCCIFNHPTRLMNTVTQKKSGFVLLPGTFRRYYYFGAEWAWWVGTMQRRQFLYLRLFTKDITYLRELAPLSLVGKEYCTNLYCKVCVANTFKNSLVDNTWLRHVNISGS